MFRFDYDTLSTVVSYHVAIDIASYETKLSLNDCKIPIVPTRSVTRQHRDFGRDISIAYTMRIYISSKREYHP